MNFKSIGLKAAVAAVAVSTVAVANTAPAHAIFFYATPGPTSDRFGATKVDFSDKVFKVGVIPTAPGSIRYDNLAPQNPGANRSENGGFDLSKRKDGDDVEIQKDPTGTIPVGSTGKYVADVKGIGNFLFDKDLFYFGFNWGSINPDNKVQFFKDASSTTDGTLLATFLGSDILTALHLGQNSKPTKYINFLSDDGKTDVWNRVLLTRSNQPFQLDDVGYKAVPTPALLPGLVGLGVAALRRRKQAAKQSVEA